MIVPERSLLTPGDCLDIAAGARAEARAAVAYGDDPAPFLAEADEYDALAVIRTAELGEEWD